MPNTGQQLSHQGFHICIVLLLFKINPASNLRRIPKQQSPRGTAVPPQQSPVEWTRHVPALTSHKAEFQKILRCEASLSKGLPRTRTHSRTSRKDILRATGEKDLFFQTLSAAERTFLSAAVDCGF